MFKTGIVSVTFRQKTIDEVLELTQRVGLEAIEVGSDVHAPQEKCDVCLAVRDSAAKNHVEIISYGSYYRLGQNCMPAEVFARYIAAAKLLGARNIRIWAGSKNSGDVTPEERTAWTAEARFCAKLAMVAGMSISFEYHQGTLTDNADSALRFMHDIDSPNARLYWQPNQAKDVEFNKAALKKVLPYVMTVHVFAWDATSGKCIRYPLADHESDWKEYLDILSSDRINRNLLIEFVKDDDAGQFLQDAETLLKWRSRYAI